MFAGEALDVNPSFDLDLQVTCRLGQMLPNVSTCLQACTPETVGELVLGPETLQFSPAERFAGDGSSFVENCSVRWGGWAVAPVPGPLKGGEAAAGSCQDGSGLAVSRHL
eukprot:Skav205460  [mRNA]  locus=scaffold4885:85742:90869:+ [translate_table: standard]